MRRFIGAATVAAATLLLAAGTVAAGGWATITPDDATGGGPGAGEEISFGFTVLQHGQTPAGWEQPTLFLENAASGETIEVRATPSGADGHFVAPVTLPDAGLWRWRVTLRDLLVETPPAYFTVTTADGSMPTFDTTMTMSLVERAVADAKNEIYADLGERSNVQGSQLDANRSQIASLARRVGEAEASRDAMQAEVAALRSAAATATPIDGGPPALVMATVGALAGAIAGFLVAWLGRGTTGPRVREVGEEVPAGYVPTTR